MGTITLDRSQDSMRLPLVINDDGRDILVQLDYDYPGIAGTFGWSPAMVRPTLAHAPADCQHDGTDGTIGCETCGLTPLAFIDSAYDYIADHEGATADDPGYFLAD